MLMVSALLFFKADDLEDLPGALVEFCDYTSIAGNRECHSADCPWTVVHCHVSRPTFLDLMLTSQLAHRSYTEDGGHLQHDH